MTADELELVLAAHRLVDLPSTRAALLLVMLVRELRSPTPDDTAKRVQAELDAEIAARLAATLPPARRSSRAQTGKPKAVLKAKGV